MIQNKLFNALKPLVSGRCFYGYIPDTNKEYPVIVYQFPNVTPNSALEDGDLDDFMVQIDVYSSNPNDTLNLRKPIFRAVENDFTFAKRLSDFGDYEPDTRLYRRCINYQIAYGD